MPQLTELGAIPSRQIFTKKYERFQGVDFSTDMTQIDDSRSPDAPNLISDEGGHPEKRVGWRTLTAMPARINGVFWFKEGACYLVHAGEKLYKWLGGTDTPKELYTGAADEMSYTRYFDERLVFLDGKRMLVFDGESVKPASSEAYIPTTIISKVKEWPSGGMAHQEVNLLTRKRREAFSYEPVTIPAGQSGGDYLYLDSTIDEKTQVYIRLVNRPDDYLLMWDTNTSHTSPIGGRGINGEAINTNFVGGILTRETYKDGKWISSVAVQIRTGYQSAVGYTPGIDNIMIEYAHTPRRQDLRRIQYSTQEQTVYLDKPPAQLGVYLRFRGISDQYLFYWAPGETNAKGGRNYQGGSTSGASYGKLIEEADGRWKIAYKLAAADASFPNAEGVDNVYIEYAAENDGKIDNCRVCETFEGRMFYSGNPDYKNTDWHSGINDPLYVPDLSYTEIGIGSAPIVGYLRHGASLAVIKEDGAQESTVFLRNAEFDSSGEMIFPVTQGVSGIGALSRHSMHSFLDDPVFLSSTGVYGIGSHDVTAERTLNIRSSRINARLTREDGLRSAVMTVWNGYLVLAVNGDAYVADVRQRSYSRNQTDTFEYEWYYWTNIPARCFCANGGALFFGTESGKLCKFNNDLFDDNGKTAMSAYNDDGAAIVAQWATRLDDDGDFMSYKTMIKKGSGVFLKAYTRSGVKVLIRTEKDFGTEILTAGAGMFTFDDIDFSNFTFNTAPFSMAPFNSKIKKYKAIQVICRNEQVDSGFGLFSIIRRYVKGNFVK